MELFVVFNTTDKGNFTNVVVAGSDKTENKTANNTTTVVEGKLDVEKITLTPVVLVGDQVIFEIVVRNVGEAVLTNVFVDESSYDGLVYDSFIDNGLWTHSVVGGKHRWTLNSDLAVNEIVEFFVVFNTTGKGNFTNVVVAGSDETENKTTNNTTKVSEPMLDVEKITLTPIVAIGNQTSFEIVVRNTGEVVLHNVVVEETSYEGLTYDSYVENKDWTYSVINGKNVWTLNKVLNVHEAVTLIVNFNTTEVGNFTNIVTVGSTESENKTANNTTHVYNSTDPDPESNKTKNPAINIEKIALNNVVIVGNQVLFEIIVTNTGNVALHNVTVSEDSFDGLTYVRWYDNSGLWNNDSYLTWTMNSPLYAGEIATFYVVFSTTTEGEFTNVVSVDSNETDKKSDNETVEVLCPDFTVEKIAINKSVAVGDKVMFEIVVHNTGKVTLNDVVVREDSYVGLDYDSFSDSTGMWVKNSDLSWNLTGPLYAGEYVGFFVVFNTASEGSFVNVVVADSKEVPNKTSNDTVEVLRPNMDVQKITINRTVYVGEQVIFEIVVHNTGKVTLNDVVVHENPFDGLVYDSFIDSTGLWSKNSDLSWSFNGPLYAGEYVGFFVVFNTTSAGNITNVIVVESDKTDNKTSNNTTVVNPVADLSVVKLVSDSNPNFGDVITWTIIVTNNGPSDSENVIVVDNLPSGLVYQSSEASIGSYDAATGVWTIGNLVYNKTATLSIKTLVNISNQEILNVAVVNSSTYDPNPDNNKANNTTDVNPSADLSIIKLVSNSNPNFGDVITWTIVVTNNGPDEAKDVYVVDKLPSGLDYQSSEATKGSYDVTTGIWTIGQLSSGSTVSLEITTLVKISNVNILNIAVVNSTTYDPNPDNNNANNTTNVSPSADLSIEKVVIVIDGEYVTWSIKVTNLGPDTAINTRASDVLSNALILVAYDLTTGSFDPNTGVWAIGDMQNGDVAILIIQTLVNATGTIVNEARVVSDTYDPNMTNNNDSDYIVVEDVPDVEPPVPAPKAVDVTPATGNPLIMILLALFALAVGTLRRKK